MIVGDVAGQVNPLTGGGIINSMQTGLIAGKVVANTIKNRDCSYESLKEYEKRFQGEIGDSFKKYLKAKEYLLSLSDNELDFVAKAFQESDFEHISPGALLKKLVNVSPQAMLKLGKLF